MAFRANECASATNDTRGRVALACCPLRLSEGPVALTLVLKEIYYRVR